jgi:hypothetical protein
VRLGKVGSLAKSAVWGGEPPWPVAHWRTAWMASTSVHARVGRGRIAVSSVVWGPSVLQPSRPLGGQPVRCLQHKRARHAGSTSHEGHAAALVASATPSASGPGHAPQHRRQGALEDAARRTAVRLTASHGHACARTNDTACRPEPSVTNVRTMLESCDNPARSAKSQGAMFRRHRGSRCG